MKSDVIAVNASGIGIKEALTQTEKIAEVKGLSKEDRMKLRLLTEEMMGRLVEATTDNRNAAAVGITGKLRSLFESMLEPKDAQTPSVAALGSLGAFAPTAGSGTSMWTLSQYRDKVQEAENAAEAWDELEKTTVTSLADEICIGIRGNCVEMTIHKKF